MVSTTHRRAIFTIFAVDDRRGILACRGPSGSGAPIRTQGVLQLHSLRVRVDERRALLDLGLGVGVLPEGGSTRGGEARRLGVRLALGWVAARLQCERRGMARLPLNTMAMHYGWR